VADAGLGAVVLKLGMVAKPAWLFDVAEAFIMTSKSEGLARVLIESFLCGKPAFALPQDGLEDIYGDAMPFFVPASRSPASLAGIIAASLATVETLRANTRKIMGDLEARHSPAGHFASLETALRMD
jgi:glycosyltransferase involved in cell wall biosynthesis